MRPTRLVMTAIGPFAGTQTVDFRELGTRTLFLIHGPTGSGKTTILDAICFALYGVSSGGDREAKRLRSDLAAPNDLTEVLFDFELGDEHYRILRKPEQTRPKRRGEGVTTEPATASLHRRTGLSGDDDEGKLLASQWSNVTQEVERLLGFRSEEFRQVVMLPQGRFRRLLMADSREREDILEVLFQTELYRRIEEALKKSARDLEALVKDAGKLKEYVLKQAGCASEEALKEQRAATAAELVELAKALTERKIKEKEALDRLAQGKEIAGKLSALNAARNESAALEARTDEFKAKREELARARRALAVLPAERALEGRLKEAEAAARRREEAEKALRAAGTARDAADKRLLEEKERAPELEEAARRLAQLDALRGRVVQLQEARRRLAGATVVLETKARTVTTSRERLETLITMQDEKQKALREAGERAGAADLLKLRAEAAAAVVQQHVRLRTNQTAEAEILRRLDAVSHKQTMAQEALLAAQSSLIALETRMHEGRAALLARTLEPGMPCPVCGSTDHPQPAVSEVAPPDDRAVKKQKQQVETRQAELEVIRDEKADLEKRRFELQAEARVITQALGDSAGRELTELKAEAESLKRQLAEAEAAKTAAASLAEEAKGLEASLGEVRALLKTAESDKADAEEAQRLAEGEVTGMSCDIPQEFQDPDALRKAAKEAGQTVRVREQALEKARQESLRCSQEFAAAEATARAGDEQTGLASANAEACRRDLESALMAEGFADRVEFRESLRTDGEIRELDEEIRAFQRNLDAAHDRLKRAERDADGLSIPDLESLERTATEAKSSLEEALRSEAAISERLKRIDASLKDYRSAVGSMEAAEARYTVVGRISNVASGGNQQGITFQRFVLAALLDDVLRAATKRLQVMSNGRYLLQRSLQRVDRRSAGGLDLEVMDSYSGTARPPATLSGGETFLASLSLALGLADVVQAYAGGIRLDTIFVDEGFGSLDPEALDLAFRALVDLRANNRLVGIISHVPDLRERITTRLEVTKGLKGSQARFELG